MTSWCQYHVGFNTGSLVELVTLQSIKEIFDTSDAEFLELEEKWVDKGYGFCTPMNFQCVSVYFSDVFLDCNFENRV